MQPMILAPAQESAPVYCVRINVRRNGDFTTVDVYADQYDCTGSSHHCESAVDANLYAAKAARQARPEARLPGDWPRVPERLGKYGV